MIIGLTGVARSGKDTVGKYLVENYGFERKAFADKLKDLAMNSNPQVKVYKDFALENGVVLDYVTDMGVDYHLPVPKDFYNISLYFLVSTVGWEKAKEIPSVREYLQNLGVGARNTFGEDFWVKQVMDSLNPETNYVITDVRFNNEAQAIFNNSFKNMVLKIERNVEKVNDHISEKGIDKFLITHTIKNNGTLEELDRVIDYIALFTKIDNFKEN